MKTLTLNERGCEINSDRLGEGKERQRGYELERKTGREDMTWIAVTYDQTRGGRKRNPFTDSFSSDSGSLNFHNRNDKGLLIIPFIEKASEG